MYVTKYLADITLRLIIKKEKIFASNYCEKYSEELVMNVYESREIIISDRKSFIDTTTIYQKKNPPTYDSFV